MEATIIQLRSSTVVLFSLLIHTLTNGSGSRRPKNIRIRIRNTGFFIARWCKCSLLTHIPLVVLHGEGDDGAGWAADPHLAVDEDPPSLHQAILPHVSHIYLLFLSVFQIPDILIRIRILGSVHWITDSDPALFVSGFQDANKNNFFCKFFAYYLGTTFTSVFNDNKTLRSQKKSWNQGFLNLP